MAFTVYICITAWILFTWSISLKASVFKLTLIIRQSVAKATFTSEEIVSTVRNDSSSELAEACQSQETPVQDSEIM